jgi:hypothetical protein
MVKRSSQVLALDRWRAFDRPKIDRSTGACQLRRRDAHWRDCVADRGQRAGARSVRIFVEALQPARIGTINDCKAGKRSLNGLTHWGYNERHRPHSCSAWSRCSLGLLHGSKEVGLTRSSKFGVPPRVTYHRGAEQRDAESARRCRLNVARIAPDARAALRRVSSGSSVSIATERPRPVSGMNDMKLSWQRDRPRGAAARCCPDEPTDCH